jgi:RNA polymerase sigma-70 factor (ECF subfamily)
MSAAAATAALPEAAPGFNEVVLPLHPVLLRAARALTRNPAEAADLVQDTLERAFRTFDRFVPGTNARAWSMAILSRLFIDRWRQRRRQPRFVDIDCLDLPAPPDEPEVMREPPPPCEQFTIEDVRHAASELPLSLRRIFELSSVTRLSYGEISAITGIRASTVGTRLLRARRRLRAMLLDRSDATRSRSTELIPVTDRPGEMHLAVEA